MSAYGLLKYCCLLLALFLMLNVTLGERLALLGRAQRLLYFQRVSFDALFVPRWQTGLAMTYVGILLGLPFNFVHVDDGVSVGGLGLRIALSVLGCWLATGAAAAWLRGWMQRGGRWDGHGSMLNLVVAASWPMAVFVAVLLTVGAPVLWTWPCWLYASGVALRALCTVIPRASVADCFGGVCGCLVLGALVIGATRWLMSAVALAGGAG